MRFNHDVKDRRLLFLRIGVLGSFGSATIDIREPFERALWIRVLHSLSLCVSTLYLHCTVLRFGFELDFLYLSGSSRLSIDALFLSTILLEVELLSRWL